MVQNFADAHAKEGCGFCSMPVTQHGSSSSAILSIIHPVLDLHGRIRVSGIARKRSTETRTSVCYGSRKDVAKPFCILTLPSDPNRRVAERLPTLGVQDGAVE